MLECLKLGKPIIISNVGYIGEILSNDYPLYCKPKDINSIVNAIQFYINMKNKKLFSENLQKLFDKFSYIKHKTNP